MLSYFSKTDDKFTRNAGSDDNSTECEGGGLNADALKALNDTNNKTTTDINDSDGNYSAAKQSFTKSKYSEDTHIEGQAELNKYGELFQDLTKRTFIDTHYDVVSMIIAYGSKYCLGILK